jgi:hypothetical protein
VLEELHMAKSSNTKVNSKTSNPVSSVDRGSARTGPVRFESDWTKNHVLDGKVRERIWRLYFDAQCGHAAAEYNLEQAGMIEMIQAHVSGKMREGDNGWCDCRWTLTERGRRAGTAKLERIILRDSPLAIAQADVKDEASDVADDCGGCDPGDPTLMQHYRILAHLLMRAERILAAEKRRES